MDINNSPTWTSESITAVIVVPLLILALAAAAYFLRRAEKEQAEDSDGFHMFEPGHLKAAWICALAVIPLALAGLWWGMS